MEDRPVCVCHGEPCYWQKDRRLTQGGWWECAVKRAAHNKTRVGDARLNARKRELWHAQDGEYIRRRRKKLATQRADIAARLTELEQEARRLAES